MRNMMKTGVLVLVLGIMIVSLTGCPNDIVIFQDRNLEDAVRDALGLPLGLFVTRTDLLQLYELEAAGREIRSLSGLQWAVNLNKLLISDNALVDLTPLTPLVNLTVLDLSVNMIKDISPVAGLANLDHLILYGNDVFNPMPLRTNAANGGLGPGDTVELDERTFLDEDEVLNPDVQALITDYGVTVILVTDAK